MKYLSGIMTFALALMCTHSVTAQSQSAADAYRVAAKSVSAAKNARETKALANSLEAPLDDAVKSLLEHGAKALEMFDAASAMPFGNWGFDTNEPMSAGRLLNNGAELADLVILRARTRGATGDRGAALDEAYKLALMSRRMSVQPSLPRELQQIALFDKAAQLAGLVLMDATPAQIESFVEKLNELRSAADPIDVIVAEERAYLVFHRQLVEDAYLRRIASAGIGPFNSLFGGKLAPVDVNDLVVDSDAANLAFAETEQAFSESVAALKLDPGERPAALAGARAKVRSSHPLAQTAMQVIDECLRLSRIPDVQMEMLRTAAAICAEQTDRPPKADPASLRAARSGFEYEPRDGGFMLKWTDPDRQVISLRIGPRLAPTTREGMTKPETRNPNQ